MKALKIISLLLMITLSNTGFSKNIDINTLSITNKTQEDIILYFVSSGIELKLPANELHEIIARNLPLQDDQMFTLLVCDKNKEKCNSLSISKDESLMVDKGYQGTCPITDDLYEEKELYYGFDKVGGYQYKQFSSEIFKFIEKDSVINIEGTLEIR